MHRARPTAAPADDRRIRALMQPRAVDHPADSFECIETHISWLILAGDFAYKIKKPIALDFLDFTTLARRKHFCEDELRLNRRWAPEIYLDVVAVTECDGTPVFGGDGEVVDYAVRMRRFRQSRRLDRQLEEGALHEPDMLELAEYIAARHAEVPPVEAARRARVMQKTRSLTEENFDALAGRLDDEPVDRLRAFTTAALDARLALLRQRFDDGCVRACHGDLHLGNLVRLPEGIRAFDCIEFNADLRYIDTQCDIAFLVMDLHARDRGDLAAHFLNRYLEVTGDYAGIAVLDLFVVYRCLVRAKVAVIMSDERESAADGRRDIAEANRYLALAMNEAGRRRPALVLMHGLSASGKTRVSSALAAALPAIRIRSDIERKRLAGLDRYASSDSPPGRGLYDEAASTSTYEQLRSLARPVLESGHVVILDAAFLDIGERRAAALLGQQMDLPVVIVDVVTDEDRLRQRIVDRASRRDEASEANLAVLDWQVSTADPLSAAEGALTITCDNSVSPDIEQLVMKVKDAIDHR